MLTGCGKKSIDTIGHTANGGTSDTTPISDSSSTDNGEAAGAEKYPDFITIDVFDGLANYQGIQSGWFAKIVKDRFNMELNMISPNVAGGGDTLYQTRSAAGDLGIRQ